MTRSPEEQLINEKRWSLTKNIAGLAMYAFGAGNLLKVLSDPLHKLHLDLRSAVDFAIQIIPGSESTASYPEDIKILNALLVVGFLYLGTRYIVKEWKDFVTLTKEMGLKRFIGKEPVPKDKNPSTVFFTQSDDVLSIIVNQSLSRRRIKDTNKNPVVGVLYGNGIPSVLGEGKMSYYIHAKINDFGKSVTSTKGGKRIREASGMLRANELVFICLDSYSGMFPQNERSLVLDTKHVYSELVDIGINNPESLKGKRITIITSKKTKLNEISLSENEFKNLADRYGFELKIITPEEIFKKRVVSKLQKIEERKKKNEKINVLVIEQEHSLEISKKESIDKNRSLLTESLRDMELLFENLLVKKMIVDRGFSSMSIDGESSDRSDSVDLIELADLVILSGQSDREVIETVEYMLRFYKTLKKEKPLDPKKITVVVDIDETAQLLKEKYKLDVFVPMSEAIKKFSMGKHASSKQK